MMRKKKHRSQQPKKQNRKTSKSVVVFAWVILGVMLAGTALSSFMMIVDSTNSNTQNYTSQEFMNGTYTTDENGNLIRVEDDTVSSSAIDN